MRRITHIQWLDASDYAAAVVIADEEDEGVPVEIDQLRARHGRPAPPLFTMRHAQMSLLRPARARGALALVRA